MDISNFSRTISKGEWDSHIDYLDSLPKIDNPE